MRDWCGFGEKGAEGEERRGGREEEGKEERERYIGRDEGRRVLLGLYMREIKIKSLEG